MAFRAVLVLCIALASAMAVANQYLNEDLFLSIAAGRDILRVGPSAPDHWAFTAEGLLWVNQSWLSHAGLCLSYDWLGPAGPLAVKVILLLACLGVLWFRCASLGARPEISLIALLLGSLALGPFLGLRPENIGLVLFLVLGWLLAATELSRRARCIALPLVMLVWANAHGSFMLGLELLCLKAGLVTLRRVFSAPWGAPSVPEWRDVGEWWLLASISFGVVAFVNPFGTDNLLMPFRQLGTVAVTQYSADWLPLLNFQHEDLGVFGGRSPFLYLLFLGGTVGASVIWAIARLRGRTSSPAVPVMRSDWAMEALIALVIVAMAFRFGRLALFAAPSLVPMAAFLLEGLMHTWWSNDQSSAVSFRVLRSVATVVACVLLIGMGFVCYRTAVVPYLPGNPFRPDRSLARELMSFDTFSPGLVHFMKANRVTDRVLSGWELSPFLMLHIPEVRLFMDCRDQSYYPLDVIRDYFTILGVVRDSRDDALRLLDRWQVEAVALTTGPVDFDRAMWLLQTRRWGCVYADPHSFLLVRVDSPRFGAMLRSGNLSELAFPDQSSKALSEAILGRFTIGRIRSDVVRDLREEASRSPWPNMYSLIVWGLDDPRGCLRPETVAYLVAEADRLARTSPLYPNGAEQVTASLVRVLEILEENAIRCGDSRGAARFGGLRVTRESRYKEMRRYYLGQSIL